MFGEITRVFQPKLSDLMRSYDYKKIIAACELFLSEILLNNKN